MEGMERTIAMLEPLLTEARVRRMRSVLETRSDHVTFVFERMIDPHNLSAALRSLDAFSFQDIHLIHPGERLALSRGITIGTDRWLSLHPAPTATACLDTLRSKGYTVYASALEGDSAHSLSGIDFSQPTALVFGNEHLGVSGDMLDQVPGRFHIDMLGFAQSLNLSVAVAVSAYHARREIERIQSAHSAPERFGLSEDRKMELYAQWLRQSVKHPEKVLGEEE